MGRGGIAFSSTFGRHDRSTVGTVLGSTTGMDPLTEEARPHPEVTVVVAAHGRPEKLARTLESIRDQELPAAAYEIIIVDDGSEPPLVCEAPPGGPAQRTLRLPHVERSVARNRGAETARGSVLVFLDDDMIVSRDLLEAHLATQRKWPGALVVGAISLPPAFERSPFGRFRRALENGAVPQAAGPVSQPNFATAANMSMSRDAFLRLAGFEPALVSAEDQDLALRHTAAGGCIVFAPAAKALHDDSVTDLRSYCRRHEWGAEQMVPFLERYPEWPENRERLEVNGPARFGADSVARLLKKSAKSLLAGRLGREALFTAAALLESIWPTSPILPALYRLALGVHLQSGFRRGLAGRSQGIAAATAAP